MSEQTKSNILVIMDSYYPDSRATTHIMGCLLDSLVARCKIYVFCLNLLKNHSSNERPTEHNGVFIGYAKPVERKSLIEKGFAKVKAEAITMKYRHRYGTTYGYEKLCIYARQIKAFAASKGIKKIVSVATPTDVHICAEMVVSSLPGAEWFPISFDPHAYNCGYSEKMREMFQHEETILYKKAKRIFFLRQSEQDYKNSVLKSKITYFDLPLLFNDDYAKNDRKATSPQAGPIKLVYAGSIYRTIRNPEYMLEVLLHLKEIDFKLYVIGGIYGWDDQLSAFLQKWEKAFGDKIEFLDRLSREDVSEYLAEADAFLNIGNTTHNQCPSKVLDYIATGKPIIHFKKIENCSSMQYLGRYPSVCIVDEQDDLEKSIARIEKFISKLSGKVIEAERLRELYGECQVPFIADLLWKYIND